MINVPFVFFSLLIALPLWAQTPDLSEDPAWLNLLHYKDGWTGLQSQIDGPTFFLAPDGKTNPQSEVLAFLKMAAAEPSELAEEKSVQCRFPARAFFLRNRFPKEAANWPARACPSFQRWFETLRGVSVSLVFSSYYLNNPSSTFGHTFLRINKAPSERTGKRYELLDYGINFAANPTTDNPVLYPILGLFGGFPGTFTTTPYYYKVREYNNAESRDLWEYELAMTPEQVDVLIAHLWELGPTYADYWYLTENCSYFILTLLESVNSNLKLTSKLKKDVIPQDTVQIVWNAPGLVKGVNYRASTRVELRTRLQKLSSEEKSWVASRVRMKSLEGLDRFPKERHPFILDAAIDFTDYRYPIEVQKRETEESQFKTHLLTARSQVPSLNDVFVIPPAELEAPHLGHGSRRLGVGFFERNNEGSGQLFSYKFALHDFLDPVVGYPESAEITFFDFQFSRLDRNRRILMEKATLFEVYSMNPISLFSRAPSWGVAVGYEKQAHQDCLDCGAGFVKGRLGGAVRLSELVGLTASAGLKAAFFYTGSGGESVQDGKKNFPRFLFGAGPEIVVKAQINSKWSGLLTGWHRFDYGVNEDQFRELELATQYSPTSEWGLRLKGIDRWFEKQGSLEVFYYY